MLVSSAAAEAAALVAKEGEPSPLHHHLVNPHHPSSFPLAASRMAEALAQQQQGKSDGPLQRLFFSSPLLPHARMTTHRRRRRRRRSRCPAESSPAAAAAATHSGGCRCCKPSEQFLSPVTEFGGPSIIVGGWRIPASHFA